MPVGMSGNLIKGWVTKIALIGMPSTAKPKTREKQQRIERRTIQSHPQKHLELYNSVSLENMSIRSSDLKKKNSRNLS